MTFYKVCKIIFVIGLVVTNSVFAKKTKRQIRKENIIYPMPIDSECYSEIDYCFNRYCFDKKTLTDGVYSKCGAQSPATVLINVEECLKTRSVIKELDLTKGCKKVSYNRVLTLMENKDRMEKGLKKNSASCQYATNMLQAAKKCYAAMINSDGSFSRSLYDELNNLCGERVSGEPDMAKRFFNAGDYGLSDLDMVNALKASGQNTVKRENWRQVVDATLAGYTEIAELSCGEEDYQITKVNDYLLDSRDNLAMIKMKEEAKQIGKKLGDKFVDRMFPGQTCKSQPLPDGALMWYYSPNSNPSCKIICKEGFVVDRSFTKCNEPKERGFKLPSINTGDEEKSKISTSVIIFPKGTGKEEKKEEPKKEEKPKKDTRCDTKEGRVEYKWCCDKESLGPYITPSIANKDRVCDLFVKNGSLSDPYWRCRPDWPGNKERFLIHGKWYDMTIQDIAGAFKESESIIGKNYSEGMSLKIKNYCCDGKKMCKWDPKNPPAGGKNGSGGSGDGSGSGGNGGGGDGTGTPDSTEGALTPEKIKECIGQIDGILAVLDFRNYRDVKNYKDINFVEGNFVLNPVCYSQKKLSISLKRTSYFVKDDNIVGNGGSKEKCYLISNMAVTPEDAEKINNVKSAVLYLDSLKKELKK